MISIETKVNQLCDEVAYLNRIIAQLKAALHTKQSHTPKLERDGVWLRLA